MSKNLWEIGAELYKAAKQDDVVFGPLEIDWDIRRVEYEIDNLDVEIAVTLGY